MRVGGSKAALNFYKKFISFYTVTCPVELKIFVQVQTFAQLLPPCLFVKSLVRQRAKVITKDVYHNDPASFARFFSQVQPY